MANQKLELTWIGKDNQPKLEPRILIEDPERSYHPLPPPYQGGDKRGGGNMLIFGDNLLALKALEQDFAGKVKCIFIDPPYNTGSAFTHYDDGLEHSLWLTLMGDRLEILRRLLADDGSLWITIDDNEAHYLKVLCDEVFGRGNFIVNSVWEKKYTVANDAKYFSDNHDHILVYAKQKDSWSINRLPRTAEVDSAYKNPDGHHKGPWKATPLQAKSGSDPNFVHIFPNGVKWSPPKGRYSAYSHERLDTLYANNEIWFGIKGTSMPARKTFLSELRSSGVVARTVWRYDEVGHNHEAKSEVKVFNEEHPFGTPKPERLLQRIIHLSTNPGDLVLDSFGGSGTTGAVAHKMGRRWIMVELGEHCHTHIIPRMQKVCDGTDQGGISKAVNWQGGGGFRYYYLAPSLLKEDKYGNWIISKEYNPAMLAAALAKQEGFRYQPDEHIYWKQGKSSEKDYIYTTTQFITVEMLDKLHDEMQPDEGLLIACKAYHASCEGRHANISIKKIPQMLLGRCEFGKDDYSLNIVNMPVEENEQEAEPEVGVSNKGNKKVKKKSEAKHSTQLSIFEGSKE